MCVTVPSFYTSSTDVRFGVVDKMQADLHVAVTLALPKAVVALAT